jgi:hypothetical protein
VELARVVEQQHVAGLGEGIVTGGRLRREQSQCGVPLVWSSAVPRTLAGLDLRHPGAFTRVG